MKKEKIEIINIEYQKMDKLKEVKHETPFGPIINTEIKEKVKKVVKTK